MEKMNFRIDYLVEKIDENRKAHEAAFREALAECRLEYIKRCQDQLEYFANNMADADFEPQIKFIKPANHLKDYDRVLEMLNNTTVDEIQLSPQDFDRYVMDVWEWSDHWKAINSTYMKGGGNNG